jgi:hypothetical protein
MEGRMEGPEMSREALIDIFEARFGRPASPSVAELVSRIDDLSVLKMLLKKAAISASPDELMRALEKLSI